MLKAGIAVRDITPKESMLLCGYPEPKDRYSTGIHDPLLASVYYLSNGETEIAMVSTDICYISKTRTAKMRTCISQHSKIPVENISLSFTHTHSGPMPDTKPFVCSSDPIEMYPEYMDGMQNAITDAVCEAKKNAFDAKVGFGIGMCGKEQGMGGNRHDPDGPQDPAVSVFAIKDRTDTLRGCMVNYSMHPTVLHANSRLITADFPCYIREYIQNRHPGAISSYLMGASGNQSTRYFRKAQDFDEAKRIGYLLGAEADKALASIVYQSDVVLSVSSVFVTPPLKEIPAYDDAVKAAEKAKKEYDELIAKNAPYAVCRSAECTVIGTDSMVSTAKVAQTVGLDKMRSLSLPLEIQSIRIGDGVMMGFACEAFVEIGLEIKEKSPFKYTILSFLTNGSTVGYVCTDKAYTEFCYEAMGSQFTFGAGKALVDASVKLINSL